MADLNAGSVPAQEGGVFASAAARHCECLPCMNV